MANPKKKIIIKEKEFEIKLLIKKSTQFIATQLKVLLILKQHKLEGISKNKVAAFTHFSHYSVTIRRN